MAIPFRRPGHLRSHALVLLVAIFGGARQLHATVVVTATNQTSTQLAPGGYVVSSTDLINAGRPTLVSATPSDATHFKFGGYTVLNNGSAGVPQPNASPAASTTMTDTANFPNEHVTYTLNTTGVGGSLTGYNILEINSISGWTDNRIWQNIGIEIAMI